MCVCVHIISQGVKESGGSERGRGVLCKGVEESVGRADVSGRRGGMILATL